MNNPCAACKRRCCHAYVVTITGYDAYVIACGLHLAPEQFLVALRQREASPTGFRLGADGGTYELALDKAKARTRDKPCVFWVGLPGGIGRCGIYPYRPFVCQTYPATLVGGTVQRREDVLCPTASWRDDRLLEPEWRNRLLRMQVEYDVYALAVARWNHHADRASAAQSLGLELYLAFLMEFYRRLDPVRSILSEGQWGKLDESWAKSLQAGCSPLLGDIPEALAPWSDVFEAIFRTALNLFPTEVP
jgi:Fe-S-cluster containining protein